MSEVHSYPLSWPIGWKRTSIPLMARFSKRDRVYSTTSPGASWSCEKRITIAVGLDRLMREVGAFTKVGRQYRIDPNRVIVSTNVKVKLDGMPYSNASEPHDSGVAIYFALDDKNVVLACDKWNRVADNIAAIAAHLSALRGQERWGVGSLDQAFAGYVALNEKTEPTCWETLDISSSATENQILDAYRRMARQTHPDKEGGSSEAFTAVVRAKDIALSTREV